MISVHLKKNTPPRVLAVFSYRYDAHLVPALIANVDPLVDGWISYDDRRGTGLFSDEVRRRSLLLTEALKMGASWVLAVDPDERFEAALVQQIGPLMADPTVGAYTFALRELYDPLHYRVDGIWGQKRQARLLSLRKGIVTPPGNLHLSWSSFLPQPKLCDTQINLYHLKMITPLRRKARAVLYNFLDPNRQSQTVGYDYLADERGARLEPIARGREYCPVHQEDNGLWMPSVPLRSQFSRRAGAFVKWLRKFRLRV